MSLSLAKKLGLNLAKRSSSPSNEFYRHDEQPVSEDQIQKIVIKSENYRRYQEVQVRSRTRFSSIYHSWWKTAKNCVELVILVACQALIDFIFSSLTQRNNLVAKRKNVLKPTKAKTFTSNTFPKRLCREQPTGLQTKTKNRIICQKI